MAVKDPVIDGVDVKPASLTPGETATITISAHDPNSITVSVSIPVRNISGGEATASVQIPFSDSLVFVPPSEATVSNPDFVLTQDTASPNVYRLTAPSA